jgi:hypothetical protein
MPAVAVAQPSVDVSVNGDVGDDTYDTTAPGDPVESTDVFYDQLQPYGTWVDEPDVGRVFIPTTDGYVPYQNGHWQDSSVGFVWISDEPYAWAVNHYGRWSYSNNYNRWYWLPDTQWGPAWVDWRQTGTHFGWAPLAPDVVIRTGWQAPIESWHYCPSEHIFDVHVTRYYEPRDRVVVIQRTAQPIAHYSMVSNVRVVVGPPHAMLVQRHINVQPVRIEARTVGRWSPAEAHAQVVHAQTNHATFEAANQKRIQSNVHISQVQAHVVETHPAIKAQVNARVNVNVNVNTNVHVDEHAGGHPAEHAPAAHVEPAHPAEPARPVEHAPAAHVEPAHPVEPARPVEHAPATHVAPAQPAHPAERPVEHAPAPATHVAPTQPAHPAERPVEHAPAPATHAAPAAPARPAPAAPAHPAPAEHPAEHKEEHH